MCVLKWVCLLYMNGVLRVCDWNGHMGSGVVGCD